MELKDDNFVEEIIDKNNFVKQLTSVLKIKNIINDNNQIIRKRLLDTDKEVKIRKIKYFKKGEEAIITFTNNKKIMFQSCVSEDEEIINKFICWINEKVDKEHALYIKKAVYSKDYSLCEFVEPKPCKNKGELFDYYFKSGELLLVLYILKCEKIKSDSIVDIKNYPVLYKVKNAFFLNNKGPDFNFSSASQIAERIIKFSVYNIEFLPEDKKDAEKEAIYQIKYGFEYMYNVVMNNKLELIDLVKKLFENNILQLSSIITNIYGLNNEDLKRQLYFIDVRFIGRTTPKTYIQFSGDKDKSYMDKNRFISLANDFGEHMIQKGIIGVKYFTTSRTWINVIERDGKYILSPLKNNLMDGNGGIALFFTYLGFITQKDHFTNIAFEAVQVIVDHINQLCINDDINIDAFEGISGEIYVMYKLYSITHNERIKGVIEKGIKCLYLLVQKNNNANRINEMCQAVDVLVSIYKDKSLTKINYTILYLIKMCYENIISNVKFRREEFDDIHVYDSILISIVKISEIIQSDNLINITQDILNIQRNLKSNISYDNLRCKKLASRIMLKKIGFQDKYIDSEIKDTINNMIKSSFGNNPYYYGSLGNLQILKYAAFILKDKELENRCINTFNEMFQETIEPIIKKEINFGNESVSLMNGVVGLSYSLIRMGHEEFIPEILLLE